MNCDHGKRVWYIRGWNNLTHNRVGWSCIPCMIRQLKLGNAIPSGRADPYGPG